MSATNIIKLKSINNGRRLYKYDLLQICGQLEYVVDRKQVATQIPIIMHICIARKNMPDDVINVILSFITCNDSFMFNVAQNVAICVAPSEIKYDSCCLAYVYYHNHGYCKSKFLIKCRKRYGNNFPHMGLL
jgi:hypothetical protein